MISTGRGRKAQALSLDMVSAILVFVLVVALFVGFFLYAKVFSIPEEYPYELDYVFQNLEANLAEQAGSGTDFFHNSRIDVQKLRAFTSSYHDQSIDEFVIGFVGDAHGIGLDASAYDVCLYIKDNDKTTFNMGSSGEDIRYLGVVDSGLCQDAIDSDRNPCEGYKDALSMISPVLIDFGDYSYNRIVQLNVVVCAK